MLYYFLLANNLIGFVDIVEILPGFQSDHSLIQLELTFEESQRGPGFWKLNIMLLENQTIIDKLKIIIIDSVEKSKTLREDQKWETLKFKIAQFCSEQSQCRAKKKKTGYKESRDKN